MAPVYAVEFTESALALLTRYQKHESQLILASIQRQLPYQPTQQTRNRKLLRTNPLADWELRIQNFRVFYDIIEHEKVGKNNCCRA